MPRPVPPHRLQLAHNRLGILQRGSQVAALHKHLGNGGAALLGQSVWGAECVCAYAWGLFLISLTGAVLVRGGRLLKTCQSLGLT